MNDIFFAFWFFLPAGLANMFPIFAAHTPGLSGLEYPLDFNLSFRGTRILGPHKTIRGLVVGVLVAIVFVWVQQMLYLNYEVFRQVPIDYTKINPIYLGLLLGAGAIFGDAMKSFFKRLFSIPSGESWLFFDQIDYILGGIIFSYWYVPLNFKYYGFIIVIYIALHFLSSSIGYFLGLKQKPV